VPWVSNADCRTAYGESAVLDSMICYGESGKDSCHGDAGAPLICGALELCGIVSFGRGCGRPGFPTVYTAVSMFNDFLVDYPQPAPEDEQPALETQECGGLLVGTSGRITISSAEANTHCLWVASVELSRTRLRVVSGSLGNGVRVHILPYRFRDAVPDDGIEAPAIGEDIYTDHPRYAIILSTGAAGLSEPIVIEYYASQWPIPVDPFTRLELHNAVSGSIVHPENGGNYADNEHAAFLIGGLAPARVTWTRFDTESSYDSVKVYQWLNGNFALQGTHSGTVMPPTYFSDSGLFLVTFTTDSSVTRTGFTFNWS